MPRIAINMPKMSMTMETGILVEWLKQVGDAVADGDVVAVVTTDKVDMEVECTTAGTLAEIVAQPDDVVPVGKPIAWLDSETDDLLGDLFASADDDSQAAAPVETPAQESERPGQADAGAPSTQAPADSKPAKIRAVPLARKLAAEAGLDLATVHPTGGAHTIRARDVREAIAARDAQPQAQPGPGVAPVATPAAAAPVVTGEPFGDAKTRRIRLATAQAMQPSASVPQFTVYRHLDLSAMDQVRRLSATRVSWTTILTRAYALVLREMPELNGQWGGDGVVAQAQVNVSMAIDTPSGLMAPVLRDADRMSLTELDRAVREMAGQARDGRPDPNWFGGGTGTVSNLGGFGVDRFNALITPPQATALSLGAVGEQVFVADHAPVVRMGCEVGLTIDHRVGDGADGARALDLLQALLSDPVRLMS